MKVDILAIGVHPDDIELACSGTLLRHINAGKTVGLLDLTQGELGTRGSATIRREEALAAANLMGAKFRKNLGMADGFFQYNPQHIKDIIRIVRMHQPDIVLANALSDRHPDHGRAAKLVADACYYAGLVKIETHDDAGNLQDRWRPSAVYHYVQDNYLEPDFVVDVTPFVAKKMELILSFRSQFFLPEAEEYAKELQSPISSKAFLDSVRAKMQTFGRPAFFDYAEGFNVGRTPGVNNLFDLV